MSDSELAKQVDEVLGSRVLGTPEELWVHTEGIHGAAHALGVGSVCKAMADLAAKVYSGLHEGEIHVLMAEFVEQQGDALHAWLREHGVTVYQPWIMHESPEGATYFKQWRITP